MNLKEFACEVCSRILGSRSSLKSHLYTHLQEKPYKCDQCEKTFCQKAKLTSHMNAHQGLKPFECFICNLQFASADRLKTHTMTHTGERPWSCEICNFSFRRKHELNRHSKIHNDTERLKLLRLVCKLCGKLSATPADRKKHILKHSDLKAKNCNLCFKSFKEKYTLSNHMILIHHDPSGILRNCNMA